MPPKDDDGDGSCSLSQRLNQNHDPFGGFCHGQFWQLIRAGDAPLVIAVDCGMKIQPQSGAWPFQSPHSPDAVLCLTVSCVPWAKMVYFPMTWSSPHDTGVNIAILQELPCMMVG